HAALPIAQHWSGGTSGRIRFDRSKIRGIMAAKTCRTDTSQTTLSRPANGVLAAPFFCSPAWARLYSEAGRGGGTTTPWRSRRLVARPYSCVIPLTSEGPGSPIPGPKFAGVWKEGRPVAKRRSYTKEQRIEAVTLAQAAGIPEASKRLGIPQGTIKRWVAQARGS